MTKISDGKGNATTNANALTRLRLQLLANGYTPLPNLDKICIYPNWPNIKVDEKFLRARGRDKKYTATGLRLDAGLTAIDNDSDDQQLVDAFADRALATELELRHALFRNSRPPREMWLCRTTEPLAGTVRSRPWLKPGEAKTKPRVMDQAVWDLLSDEEREVQGKPKIHRLEVLNGSGRQIGAFGPHSHNPDGSVKYSYSWEDDISPATTPLAELPALSPPALGRLCELFDECALALGFVELPVKARPHGSVLYTLTPDMEIETLLDGVMTIEAAREWADSTYDSEHRCSWSFDEPSHDNPTHCSVRYTRAHGLEIHVHGEGLTYREADRKPPDTAELGAVLADVQPETASSDEPGPKPMSSIEIVENDSKATCYNAVAWLQQHYAWWQKGFRGHGAVIPIWATNGKAEPATIAALKITMMPYDYLTVSKTGTVKRHSPVGIWLALPESVRVNVDGSRMRPDQPWPLFSEGGQTYVNTYRRRQHPRQGGSLAAWQAFFERLFPYADERAWYEQRLAWKWQHPEVPGVTPVHVTRPQGTGRGTLFEIIGLLFGKEYCITVDFASRTGARSGSEFNAMEADALFVFVNEAAEDDGNTWRKRHNAYEVLKATLDPSGSYQRMFMAKGQMPYWQASAASHEIASNNPDALKIPAEDRRAAVLRNSRQPMTEDQGDEIRAWMAEAANIGALARHLEGIKRDKAIFDPFRAPVTQGKLDMIDLARTDIEDVWDQAVHLLPADLFTMPQAIAAVRSLVPALATGDYETKMKWHVANRSVRLRERDEPNYRFRYKGRLEVVYAKGEDERSHWQGRSGSVISAELARNDDEASRRNVLPFTPPKK